MNWLERHPTLVNLLMPFGVALLTGIWASLFVFHLTAARAPGMPAWQHLVLVAALALLGLQVLYNHHRESPDRRVIKAILDLGTRFLAEHPDPPVDLARLRAMVHLCKKTRPGPKLALQRCLVPRYSLSPVPPRDSGAIPVDLESFKRWYVNVQAMHRQTVVCSEPDLMTRPEPDGFYVSTPSLFKQRSVISAPIWSRIGQPRVIGTLTFDSVHSLQELAWLRHGRLDEAVSDMMTSAAELIGRILTRDTQER